MKLGKTYFSGSITFDEGNNVIGPSSATFESITVSNTLNVTGNITGAATTASYVEFTDIANKPTLISSSNQLAGETVDGDLTVTGRITAQEFHTEYVSGSIIYTSGSTKFGDSADDTHQITGSIRTSTNSDLYVGRTLYADHIDSGGSTMNINAGSGFEVLNLGSSYTYTDKLRVGTIYSATGTGLFKIDPTSGNVGIGTTDPSAKLTIDVSNGTALALRNTDNSIGGGEALGIIMEYPNALGSSTGWNILSRYAGGNLQINSNIDNAGYAERIVIAENGETTFFNNIRFGTADGVDWKIVGNANGPLIKLRRNSATADRYGILGWRGNDTSEYDAIKWQDTTVTMPGALGIGTTSPTQTLDVNGNIRTTSALRIEKAPSDTVGNGGNIYFIGGDGASYSQIQQGTNKLDFWGFDGSAWDINMSIDNSNRRVGIGTTVPTTALHVNGFIRSSGISTDNSAKSYVWRLDNTSGSGTTWYRIARYTAGQSGRIRIILTGQPGYSNNSSYGGTATIVAQYNNANNLQGSFWQEGRNKSVYGVNFEQISGTDYYINIQLGSFSEYVIEAVISDGTLTPDVQLSTAGISANVDDTKRIISKAIFANEAVAIGTTNYAPGLNNNLTVGGIKAQTANAGGQFSGGYTTVYTLTNMTNSYIGGRIKAYAHENGNVNTSYVEYYLLRSSSGWTINQIGTRVQAGNGHGHITLQISGNDLQMKNDLNSSIGYGYVTLDLFTIS